MSIAEKIFAPDSFFSKNFYFLAKRFVAGEAIPQAIEAVRTLNQQGMTASIDFLGEDIFDRAAATRTRDVYYQLIDAIGSSGVQTNVSVKLTALGLRIDENFCFEVLASILQHASKLPDPFVRIDMEGTPVTEITLRMFYRAFEQYKNVGPVLQAYLKRTPGDVDRAIEAGARVRLCKGAYNEPPALAYKSMDRIREQYLECAHRLLTRGNYPGLATHDPKLQNPLKEFIQANKIANDRYEFQMLYGVRPYMQRQMVAEGHRLRIYIPFGTHWAGYFYRRVAERRENLWFALSSMFFR